MSIITTIKFTQKDLLKLHKTRTMVQQKPKKQTNKKQYKRNKKVIIEE